MTVAIQPKIGLGQKQKKKQTKKKNHKKTTKKQSQFREVCN